MTKIVCSNIDCKYCGEKYVCQKEKVKMIYKSVVTVNKDRQNVLQCKDYELDEKWVEFSNNIQSHIFNGVFGE